MIWDRKKPYDEWICLNNACTKRFEHWRNQDGDSACSWCGEQRKWTGRYAPGSDRNKRLNLDTGKWEQRHTVSSPTAYSATGVQTVGTRGAGGYIEG